ncbi:unnamed protein product [Closterium sp. NIES-64]|nr:unnamed protein product [Closterium sp. NIES-64]
MLRAPIMIPFFPSAAHMLSHSHMFQCSFFPRFLSLVLISHDSIMLLHALICSSMLTCAILPFSLALVLMHHISCALTFSHAPIPCSHAPIRITGAARDASMNARLKVGSQVSTSQCSMFSNPTTTGAARDPNPDAQLQVGTRVSINGHAITFSSLRCVDIPAKSACGRQKVQVAWTRPHADADCSKIQFFSKPGCKQRALDTLVRGSHGAKTIAKAAKSVRCIIAIPPFRFFSTPSLPGLQSTCADTWHAVCPTNFSCAATTDRRGVACVCEGNTQSTDGSCTVDEEYYTAPEPAPSPTDTDVCANSTRNPCKYGSCISGGPGSYSCVCPPLHGDTCESVAASLGLSSSSLPLLNPGSVCSSPLNPSRSLCIERDDGKVGTGEQRCNSLYSVSCTSSCTAVVGDRQLVSLLELYRLNPGLVCYSSVNAGREARWPEICTKATQHDDYGSCTKGRPRLFKASASCSSVIGRAFGGSTELT